MKLYECAACERVYIVEPGEYTCKCGRDLKPLTFRRIIQLGANMKPTKCLCKCGEDARPGSKYASEAHAKRHRNRVSWRKSHPLPEPKQEPEHVCNTSRFGFCIKCRQDKRRAEGGKHTWGAKLTIPSGTISFQR
jgi:hypothetical protein